LRWAALVHTEDTRPLEELESLLREKGELAEVEEVRRSIESRRARHRAGS
jgi:hypothetical protein